jgi:hypothetical protein
MKAFKSIFGILIFAAILPLISSCESELNSKESKDGGGGDEIKLSTYNVSFGSAADSVVITSKGEWWFTNIQTSSKTYETVWARGDNGYPSSWNVGKSDTLAYKISSIIKDAQCTIKDDFFDIREIGLKSLFIKLNANEASTDRSVIIGIESGDCFENVTILQSGKK